MAARENYVADWPQAFPAEEYALRRQKVADELNDSGFDAILVTNPADLCYLTGYDMIWFNTKCMISCLVNANGNEVEFFDYPMHQTMVETTPEIRKITWLGREDIGKDSQTIASVLTNSGLKGKKVAIQRWGYSPHTDIMDILIKTLQDNGITVDDGSSLVAGVRLYKTQREVDCIRIAASIADNAMIAAREAIKPGLMETELQAEIMYSMMLAGGGDPAIRCMIGSGPRAGTHHSPAQHRRIQRDELIFVDFCSSLHRYHVNLNRTFALGEVDQRWSSLLDRAAGTIDQIIDNIVPGDRMSKMQKTADDYTDEQGLREYVWFVGGYALGISMPPDWVGEYVKLPTRNGADRILEPGMVFNFEGQFDDKENWCGGSGVAFIETILVTDQGLEVLSVLPRNLITLEA